jgi:site-specific recombinase XerD
LQEYVKERNKLGYKTEYLIVSSNEDKGLSPHGLKHWTKKLIKLSGVKFHLHRFRHTFACNLAKQNISILKIRDLMGHKNIKMTETYLRSLTMEDTREDINKLSIM